MHATNRIRLHDPRRDDTDAAKQEAGKLAGAAKLLSDIFGPKADETVRRLQAEAIRLKRAA